MNENKRCLKSGLVLGIVMLLVVCSLGVIASPARAAIVPQWTDAPDMGDSRTQAVVVNDEDGLVYVMGGVSSISGGSYDLPVAGASSYDPDTGTWTDLEPMPTGVRGAAGALGQDGRVYVIGGTDGSAPVSLTQIYDPGSNTWSAGAPMPVASWEAKAVAIQDDTIVVAGGEGPGAGVYRYDIGDDSWTIGASMPVATLGGVFVTDGFYSFYIGGADLSYVAQNNVFVYYPWDSWSPLPDMPAAVAGNGGTLAADGLVYVFGGGASAFNVEVATAAGYCFNPGDLSWTALPNMLLASKYLGAAATPDGRILAIGGNDDTTVMAKVESMRVMSVTIALSQTTVSSGGSILVTVTMDFAYGVPASYHLYTYLEDSDDVVYSVKEISSPLPNSFGYEMSVPEMATPGLYVLVLHDLVAYYEHGGSSLPGELSYQVTVIDAYSLDEQLSMLGANVSALQYQINVLAATLAGANAALFENLTAINAQMDYLFGQLAVLQAALTQIGTGLQTMGAAQQAAMDDLNDTLAALQVQLDHFQEQIDRVENKADNAGTYGIATMVLVVLILVLLVIMMMMARKKP